MIVLDASVLVDVVVRAGPAEWALDVMGSQEVSAPGHQPAEALSALARLSRSGVLPPHLLREKVRAATQFPQSLVPLDERLILRAVDLSESVRVADGLYVALAEQLRCPLVTTDMRLARSVATCEVWTPG